MLIGALLVSGLAFYVYPQSLGALVGGFAGAAYPPSFDDREDRRYWRAFGGWLIAAGVTLTGAYFLVHSLVGADVELRRFDRQWGPGQLTASPWVDHPWAWLPLFSAAEGSSRRSGAATFSSTIRTTPS